MKLVAIVASLLLAMATPVTAQSGGWYFLVYCGVPAACGPVTGWWNGPYPTLEECSAAATAYRNSPFGQWPYSVGTCGQPF